MQPHIKYFLTSNTWLVRAVEACLSQCHQSSPVKMDFNPSMPGLYGLNWKDPKVIFLQEVIGWHRTIWFNSTNQSSRPKHNVRPRLTRTDGQPNWAPPWSLPGKLTQGFFPPYLQPPLMKCVFVNFTLSQRVITLWATLGNPHANQIFLLSSISMFPVPHLSNELRTWVDTLPQV